jgi:polyphosphate kinase
MGCLDTIELCSTMLVDDPRAWRQLLDATLAEAADDPEVIAVKHVAAESPDAAAVEALCRAARRGREVVVITDSNMPLGMRRAMQWRLGEAGAHVCSAGLRPPPSMSLVVRAEVDEILSYGLVGLRRGGMGSTDPAVVGAIAGCINQLSGLGTAPQAVRHLQQVIALPPDSAA